jgi:glycosyltransferase involved in cell wall biosynthesis
MRIAQVAPLIESVPPKLYGGTERVVSYLTDELVRRGHDVTLFASGDSITSARLVPGCPEALRLRGGCVDPWARHITMVEEVFSRRDEFDIIHFHIDYVHLPTARREHTVHVSTLHGRLDIPDLNPLYRRFADAPLPSITGCPRIVMSLRIGPELISLSWEDCPRKKALTRRLRSPSELVFP